MLYRGGGLGETPRIEWKEREARVRTRIGLAPGEQPCAHNHHLVGVPRLERNWSNMDCGYKGFLNKHPNLRPYLKEYPGSFIDWTQGVERGPWRTVRPPPAHATSADCSYRLDRGLTYKDILRYSSMYVCSHSEVLPSFYMFASGSFLSSTVVVL